jgi:hypothetical protein
MCESLVETILMFSSKLGLQIQLTLPGLVLQKNSASGTLLTTHSMEPRRIGFSLGGSPQTLAVHVERIGQQEMGKFAM